MTDLRADLEQLADDMAYDVADAPARIRAVLAKHPVEPAPRVPCTCYPDPRDHEDGCAHLWTEPAGVSDEVTFTAMRAFDGKAGYSKPERIRTALEAALPHLQPQPVASTSLGLTRAEIRDEVDELIRNAYAEGWREAKQRPDVEPPALEIDWTQPGGVRIAVVWCTTPVARERLKHAVWRAVYDAAITPGLQPSGVADKATESLLAAGVFREPPTREQIRNAVDAAWLAPDAGSETVGAAVLNLLGGVACPDCGLVDDHKGGCPQTGEAPQPGAPG